MPQRLEWGGTFNRRRTSRPLRVTAADGKLTIAHMTLWGVPEGKLVKSLFRPICIVVCIVAAYLGAAQAQSAELLKVDVPFGFVAANKSLPAGSYELRRVWDSNPNLLRLSNKKGDGVVLFLPHNNSLTSRNTKFVFVPNGENYVLALLRSKGNEYAFENSSALRARNDVASEYVISGSN